MQALLKCCIQQALETTSMVVGVAAASIQMMARQGQQGKEPQTGATNGRLRQQPLVIAIGIVSCFIEM